MLNFLDGVYGAIYDVFYGMAFMISIVAIWPTFKERIINPIKGRLARVK